MKRIPGVQEITNSMLCTRFDLCQVGNLRDPNTGEPPRKRLEVHTTSGSLHRNLSSRLCPGLHQHKPIAGQVSINGQWMPLSMYTENYPVKFARQVAKLLIKQVSCSVLAAQDSSDDHPTKKRRLAGKMDLQTIAQRF